MKTKLKRFCSLLICLISMFSAVSFGGCFSESNYVRTKLNYGLGDVSYEMNSLLEPCCTADYLSAVCGGYGVNTFRIWMSNSDLFIRDAKSDEVSLNPTKTAAIHDLCAKMKAQGVTRLCAMNNTFLFPYGYTQTTNAVVPDPIDEYDYYVRFLNMTEKCYELLAREFTEIDYFEVMNEPDHEIQSVIHKNGYIFNGSTTQNQEFFYSDTERVRIWMDLQYYATSGVRKVSQDKKILSPAFCAYTVSMDFLDMCYEAIESETLPTGKNYSVTDPDSYFEILNWHPYILSNGAKAMDESWAQFQRDFYAVAQKHNDGNTPVWFTEMGFSAGNNYDGMDLESDDSESACAELLEKMFSYVDQLPFIDTVIVFRITNLYATDVSVYENNFGMLQSICDPSVTVDNVVKEVGKSYFKVINGDKPISQLTDKIKDFIGLYVK